MLGGFSGVHAPVLEFTLYIETELLVTFDT